MYMQPNPDPLEDAVQDLIIDLCEILYKRGFRTVPIGAIMRLIGVDEARAAEHDNEIFSLDNEFELLLKVKQEEQNIPSSPPPGAILH